MWKQVARRQAAQDPNQRDFCTHESAQGVDAKANDDPTKVWRCEDCDVRYRMEWDGHAIVRVLLPAEEGV